MSDCLECQGLLKKIENLEIQLSIKTDQLEAKKEQLEVKLIQLQENDNIEREQLMEEFENMIEELTKENENKDSEINKLKMRLADLEHERDEVKNAKERLSKRFMVRKMF